MKKKEWMNFMKKIMVIVFVFCLGIINVSATENSITSSTAENTVGGNGSLQASLDQLPVTYTTGNYTYVIEGVNINIYNVKVSDDDIITLSANPTYVLPVTGSNYSILPEAMKANMLDNDSFSTMNSYNATFVKLNLGIDSSTVEQLVKQKLNSEGVEVTENNIYFVTLSVDFHFTNTPNYAGYQVDFMKCLVADLTDDGFYDLTDEEIFNSYIKKISKDQSISQILGFYVLKDQFQDETEDIGLSDSVYFTDNKDLLFSYENATGNMEEFTLHNLNDVSGFADNLQPENTSKVIQNISNTIDNALVVDVPDTGFSVANLFYVVGLAVVFIGGGVICLTVWYKKKKA